MDKKDIKKLLSRNTRRARLYLYKKALSTIRYSEVETAYMCAHIEWEIRKQLNITSIPSRFSTHSQADVKKNFPEMYEHMPEGERLNLDEYCGPWFRMNTIGKNRRIHILLDCIE